MTAAVRGQTPCPQGFAGRERRWFVVETLSTRGVTPFEIRFSRCRTVVVRDPKTGRYHTEEICFGIGIVPAKVPGGPIG